MNKNLRSQDKIRRILFVALFIPSEKKKKKKGMVWRAIQRGNASDGPPNSVTQSDIDAPHVEAITSQRYERWIIDDKPNDGWSLNTPAPLLEIQSFEEDLDELSSNNNINAGGRDESGVNSVAHSRTGSVLSSLNNNSNNGGEREYARSEISNLSRSTLEETSAIENGTSIHTNNINNNNRNQNQQRRAPASMVDGLPFMTLYDPLIRDKIPFPGAHAVTAAPKTALPRSPSEATHVSQNQRAREMNSLRFLFRLQSIDFEVGNYETIECVAFLIDLQQKKRLSEAFYFSWSPGDERDGNPEKPSAVFAIPHHRCAASVRLFVQIAHVTPEFGGLDPKVYTMRDDKKAKSYAEREILRVKQLKYGNTGGGGGMQTQQQAANGKIFSIDDDEDSNSNNKVGASDDEDSGDDGSELDDSNSVSKKMQNFRNVVRKKANSSTTTSQNDDSSVKNNNLGMDRRGGENRNDDDNNNNRISSTFDEASKPRSLIGWITMSIFENATDANGRPSFRVRDTAECSQLYRVKEAYTESAIIDAAASAGVSHPLKSHKPIRCKIFAEVLRLRSIAPQKQKQQDKQEQQQQDTSATMLPEPRLPPYVVHIKDLSETSSLKSNWESAWGNTLDCGLRREVFIDIRNIDLCKRKDLRVKMELRDDDLNINAKGLPATFPSPDGRNKVSEFWTPLSVGKTKGGVFCSEARATLPARLKPSHHLILSVYGTDQNAKNLFLGSVQSEEELIGHSVIPLCVAPETLAPNIASANNPNGVELGLVAVKELLPKYLQANVRAHMPYWNERVPCVHVKMRLADTLHTADGRIGNFYAATAAWAEGASGREAVDRLLSATRNLPLAEGAALLAHLPAIFKMLLRLTRLEGALDDVSHSNNYNNQSAIDESYGAKNDSNLNGIDAWNNLASDDKKVPEFAHVVGDSRSELSGSEFRDSAFGGNSWSTRSKSYVLIEEEDDLNRDVGDLAFRALIRVAAKVQTIEPGEDLGGGLAPHSPPLEAFVTLAFGTEAYKSGYIDKLDRSLPRSKASVTPMHTILARRFSAVLTDRTGASPYEDALSVSWFALGLISRAYALDRAQIPRDAVSVDKDATPLKGVAEALSLEVSARASRANKNTNPRELMRVRTLNANLAALLSDILAIPGIKSSKNNKTSSSEKATGEKIGDSGNHFRLGSGLVGPLGPLSIELAAAHARALADGTASHAALLKEFSEFLAASPALLDIITADVTRAWDPAITAREEREIRCDGNYDDRPQDDFSSSGIQRRPRVSVSDDIDDIEDVGSLDDIVDGVRKTSLDSDVSLPANANIDVKKHDGSKSKAIASSYDGVRDVTLVTPGEAFVFALTASTGRGLSQSKTDAARAACATRTVACVTARHGWNAGWQKPAARRAIAAAYAPMLRLMIRARDVIANLQSSLAKKDALAVFLALARDSDPAKLWGWLSQDRERVRSFISLLRDAAEAFEVKPDDEFMSEENPAVLSGISQSGVLSWLPRGPSTRTEAWSREAAGHLSTAATTSILRLLRDAWKRVDHESQFNKRTQQINSPALQGAKEEDIFSEPLPMASSLLDSKSELARKGVSGGIGAHGGSEFNVLEAIMGVLAALLRRSQSATGWVLQAPLLNAVIRERKYVLFEPLYRAPCEDVDGVFPPLEAPYPGAKPFAFLESACVALLRCAARPQPARSLAVGGLRALLESALDVGGGVECLRPTLTYALLQGLQPFGHNARAGGVSRALRALSEPVSSTNGSSQSPANWKSATNSLIRAIAFSEARVREVALATTGSRKTSDVCRAVELESALALALEASSSAQIKVLSSLCKRLESEEHWVEAGEAACAAAVVCMRALASVAPDTSTWTAEDAIQLRDAFFGLGPRGAPEPTIAALRVGAEEVGEKRVLEHLAAAAKCFTRGGFDEAAIRVVKASLKAWERRRDFKALAAAHHTLADLHLRCPMPLLDERTHSRNDEFFTDTPKPPREPATYWRVRALGEAWGSLTGAQWLYRDARDRTLADMSNRVRKWLQSYVPAGIKVSQLPTAGDPTPGFGIAGIQVTAVLPFDFESEVKASSSSDNQDINEAFKRALQKLDEEEFDELDEEARRINGGAVGGSCFERARIFAFDTPFMVENNARRAGSDGNNNGVYNDLRSRGRRRLTLATKKAFPSFCPRSEIAFTRVVEMSPLSSAAEMLRAQGQALMKAARQKNVNPEMLQRLLQGSLAAGVNGGVPALVRAFFPFAYEGTNTNVDSVPPHVADANAHVVGGSAATSPEGTIKSGKAGFQKKNSSVLGDLLGRHKRGISMSDNFDGVPLEGPDGDMHSRDQSRAEQVFLSPRHSFSVDILTATPDRANAKQNPLDLTAPLVEPISPSMLSGNVDDPSTPRNSTNMDSKDSKDLVNALWELRDACAEAVKAHEKLDVVNPQLQGLFENSLRTLGSDISRVAWVQHTAKMNSNINNNNNNNNNNNTSNTNNNSNSNTVGGK
jgi:hypothetical protein